MALDADQAVGLRLLPFASRFGVYGVGRSSGVRDERSTSDVAVVVSADDVDVDVDVLLEVLRLGLWLFEVASAGGTSRDAGATAAE